VNSPLRDPHPGHTPATFLLTAGLDPTAGDARAYGARLRQAGVAIEEAIFEGWTHGFLFWGDAHGSSAAPNQSAGALRKALT
jgi:acetyl esterase